MLNLKERPQMIDNAPVGRIARVQLASKLPGVPGEAPGVSTAGTVLGVGQRALSNIAGGIARLGRVLSGPPMSERRRFRYPATASEIQTHRAMAANWLQPPSR